MSKKHNNVNPDHYKVRGREPQGQDVIHELERQSYGQEHASMEEDASATPPPIPGTLNKKPDQIKKPSK